jgi:predicted ATPase
MKRYILTGAPGAGKTAVLHALRDRGLATVAEAATDVIAVEQRRGADEPWREDGFLGQITDLQLRRLAVVPPGDPAVQVHDRSVLCTLALARFLDLPVSAGLSRAVERVVREHLYEPAAFLVRPIGFVTPTAARRIGYAESLAFERVHEQVYREHGFELVDVPAAPVADRAEAIVARLAAGGAAGHG